jgi:hypothetical protein|tara:strand:+ start:4510 stop:5163 length:654 start_codon:yes stop_codon:yes gene_type:complete
MKKNTSFIKYTKIGAVAVLGLASSYVAGTFTPNNWTVTKIVAKAEEKIIEEWNDFGFIEPSIEYTNNAQFVLGVSRCIDFINLHTEIDNRVPRDIIVAMAILETGYGKSRFALEGNNLFGIRTWDKDTPQLKPLELPNAAFGVKMYKTKCASVKDMIHTINTHRAYIDYRLERDKQEATGLLDINAQVDQLHKWSTNPNYTALVKEKILILQGKQHD